MTDAELEHHLQTLQSLTHQWQTEFWGRDLNSEEKGFLRSPASPHEVRRCENFVGRNFSPSYRHFLSLHNGWEGHRGVNFLGTHDYESGEIRRRFAAFMYGWLNGNNVPIAGVAEEEFLPERLYRLADEGSAVPEHLVALKSFLDGFDQVDDLGYSSLEEAATSTEKAWLCLPRHTVIAMGEDGELILLNTSTLNDVGEMSIESCYSDGGFHCKVRNFYDLLTNEIKGYQSSDY